MANGRRAIVAGATGLVGSALLRQLLADPDYAAVVALVRRRPPIDHPKLTSLLVDYDRLADINSALHGDDLFCCLGTTMKKAGSPAAFRRVDFDYPLALGKQAKAAGFAQFLIVTAMGANPHSSFLYNRVKGEVEDALRTLGLPALHIFRPSLLLGDRAEVRTGERIGSVLALAARPLLIGRLRPYRPIAGDTVARAMMRQAKEQMYGNHVYDSSAIAIKGAPGGPA